MNDLTPYYGPDQIPGQNQIPAGQEDMYILKSQIVPPVCPRCPTLCNSNTNTNIGCPSCGNGNSSSTSTIPDYTQTTSSQTLNNNTITPGNNVNNSPAGSISSDTGYNNGTTVDYNQYRNNTKFSPVPVVSNFSTFAM